MASVKQALVTTATVLAVIFVLRQLPGGDKIVDTAVRGY